MTAARAHSGERRQQTRGDRQRQAIIDAVEQLVAEVAITELSIAEITKRAGITRSGFYFYFESKYAALAAALVGASDEFEELTDSLASRGPDEPVDRFVRRMIDSAAQAYGHHAPLLDACLQASTSDDQIRQMVTMLLAAYADRVTALVEAENTAGAADLVSSDTAEAVRMLVGMTIMALQRDSILALTDPARTHAALAAIWKRSIWGTSA